MKSLTLIAIYVIFFASIIGYFVYSPVPFNAPVLPSNVYEEVFYPVSHLGSVPFTEVPGVSSKCITVAPNGVIFMGTLDGRIIYYDPTTEKLELLVTLGKILGRSYPLGLEYVRAQNVLLVADALNGILAIDVAKPQRVKKLAGGATTLGGTINFCNDVAVPKSNPAHIYFTDSTSFFDRTSPDFFSTAIFNYLSAYPSGKIYRFNQNTNATEVVFDKLQFPSGLYVDPNDEYILVCETFNLQILKIYLYGEKAGSYEIFSDLLPFYPISITSGQNGTFWVGSLMSRDKFFESLILPNASIKEFLLKLPLWTYQWLLPQTNPSLLQVTASGRPIYNFLAKFKEGETLGSITGLAEYNGRLVMASFHSAHAAIFPVHF